uniref:Uncharacterized protein n=1 Tax=Rhizophora mucronata TaxID=61149 RepID=A0A2P2QXC8_RHIMU
MQLFPFQKCHVKLVALPIFSLKISHMTV